MTIVEAEAASNIEFDIEGFGDFDGSCYYAVPSGLAALRFMVHAASSASVDPRQGRIARVEVSGPPWLTASGIGVGSSADEARDVYGDRLESEPHEYQDGGVYLIFEPDDPADRDFAVRFVSSDGVTIDRIFSGRADAVQLVEGCA